MLYFLKCCGFQELGSVGEDGKAKRGRYLMSSLHSSVVDFFPSLSVEIPNDTALLPVVPLYTMKKTYVSYVYHNSKYTGTKAKHPRNEYRIYLNSEIENHKLYFAAEDIVVMRKSNKPLVDEDGNEQHVYYLDVIKDHYSGLYIQLNKIIEQYPIRGGYGLYDGKLDFFEEQVKAFESGKGISAVCIDKTVTDRIKNSTEENRLNVFNAATFKDFVMAGYGNACAVTGKPYSQGIDVVYIEPKEHGGTCMPNNGLALSKELSLPFLQGEFTLSERFEVIVHPDCINDNIKQYHLTQIRVPHNKFFQPSQNSLIYHREKVYGAFTKK